MLILGLLFLKAAVIGYAEPKAGTIKHTQGIIEQVNYGSYRKTRYPHIVINSVKYNFDNKEDYRNTIGKYGEIKYIQRSNENIVIEFRISSQMIYDYSKWKEENTSARIFYSIMFFIFFFMGGGSILLALEESNAT